MYFMRILAYNQRMHHPSIWLGSVRHPATKEFLLHLYSLFRITNSSYYRNRCVLPSFIVPIGS